MPELILYDLNAVNFQMLDWLIVAACLLLFVGISISYTGESGRSLSSFFLGGRNLPWYIAGLSMVATTFAADTPLAVSELIGKNGIAGNWVWWNFLLGGMLTTFFFAALWRRAGVLTEVELIELRYSGIAAKLLRAFKAVYLGLFMNVLIIGWVNFAMISILQGFFDISHQSAFWYTMAAMALVAVYSSFGGLKGVAVTDTLQFILAMTGSIVLSVLVIQSPEIGGISGLKTQLNHIHPGTLRFFPSIGQSAAGLTLSIGLGAFFARIGVQWWSSWYPGAEPGGGGYIAQRMMSTPNEKEATWATMLFQVMHYAVRPWPWILVGLSAIVLYPDLAADSKQMGYVYAMRDFLPVGLKGLMLAAFFAAYMSTISTQLNWGASYLVNDLYKRFIFQSKNQNNDRHFVLVSRIMTVLIMAVAVFISAQIQSIAEVWNFIFQCGAGLGLVLIMRWYWWRINAWSEITATFVPFIGYALSAYYFHFDFAGSMFFTSGLTSVAWLLITFLTKPESHETLSLFYQRVKPGGWWSSYAKQLGKVPKVPLGGLFLTWLSAVLMTYSLLFASGKLILMEWSEASIYASLAVIGLLLMLKFAKSYYIFNSHDS